MSIDVTVRLQASPELELSLRHLVRAIEGLTSALEKRDTRPGATEQSARPAEARGTVLPNSDREGTPALTPPAPVAVPQPAGEALASAVRSPAPAEPPAAKAPLPKPVRLRAWNEARDALGARLWLEGKTAAEVKVAVNELPGETPVADNQSVHARAFYHKWRRPPQSPRPDEPIVTDFATIAQWAAARGIQFTGRNIDEVNAKCRALNVRGFALERGGARGVTRIADRRRRKLLPTRPARLTRALVTGEVSFTNLAPRCMSARGFLWP